MLHLLLVLSAFASDAHWDEVAASAGMERAEVERLCAGLNKQQSVLDRMATPWEKKPWHSYAKIFLTDKRRADGLAFWSENEPALARAEAEYGVPAEIIVSIIGVETSYGANMGRDGVAEALYTLGFFHERRGPFFRKELGNYLRLATDEGWDLRGRVGSYAGAMGLGQFMPSSYRTWAVDGDGDGKKDLFDNREDAIASVANYFVAHGWRRGQPVMLDAAVTGSAADLHTRELKPTQSWQELAAAGVSVSGDAPDGATLARLYRFRTADGAEYRVGLHNFYVITRYNHSRLYARAVFDLATQLAEGRASR